MRKKPLKLTYKDFQYFGDDEGKRIEAQKAYSDYLLNLDPEAYIKKQNRNASKSIFPKKLKEKIISDLKE